MHHDFALTIKALIALAEEQHLLHEGLPSKHRPKKQSYSLRQKLHFILHSALCLCKVGLVLHSM